MATSRDANDPRDELRAMREEALEEFQEAEAHDTGGATHRSPADREGVPAERRAAEERAPGGPPRGAGEEAARGPERAAGLPVTPPPDPGHD